MKKLILFLVCLFALNVSAQDYYHYYASTSISIGTKNTYALTESIVTYQQVGDNSFLQLGCNLNFCVIDLEYYNNINLEFGFTLKTIEYIYCFATFIPHCSIHGNGVQTNGDIVDFWTNLNAGLEIRKNLNYGYVYTKLGISAEIDFNVIHDNIYLFCNIGYNYLIR